MNDDELTTIQLRKDEVELFKKIMAREAAWNYFESVVKSTWIWVVAGGILNG
jgi:hypothetical protein